MYYNMNREHKAYTLYIMRLINPPDNRWECLTKKRNKKWKYYFSSLFCVHNYTELSTHF